MPPPRNALLALFLALAPPACAPPGAGSGEVGRGVLLIAVDGLRADHVSAYGYDRPTTQRLDELAGEGVLFEECFSTAPLALPAHVSLLTGCDPNVARRIRLFDEAGASAEQRWRVPDGLPRLAVEMLASGRATAAFVDAATMGKGFGFAPGFQTYREIPHGDAPRESGLVETSRQLLQWLRELDRSKRWFAYVHVRDLERGWTHPDPQWERFFTPREGMDEIPPLGSSDGVFFAVPRSRWRPMRTMGEYEALYDGHVRRLDEGIEALLASLRLLGRYDATTIAVVGTHGVQLGEAGLFLTSGLYSLADLHVPWILRAPGLGPAGGRMEAIASLADVAPTLLELEGIAVPRGTHGVSQLPVLRDPDAAPLRPYAVASCGLTDGGVLLDPRWVFELQRLRPSAPVTLRRSWYGAPRPEGDWSERFYDRTRTRFPPLWWSAEPPPHVEEMRATAARWDHYVQLARRILQGGTLFHEPATPETIAELVELGYLGDDP